MHWHGAIMRPRHPRDASHRHLASQVFIRTLEACGCGPPPANRDSDKWTAEGARPKPDDT
jgi:hypothetical protein